MRLALGPAGGKYERGPVQLVFDAGRNDADHTFMKARLVDCNCGRWLVIQINHRVCGQLRLFAHVGFNITPFTVDTVQRFGQLIGSACIIGQQAFNTQRHVGQTACSVDARAEGKAKVEGSGDIGFAPSCYKKTGYPRRYLTASDTF